MANQLFGNFVYTNAGVAVSGATADLFDRNTTTPVRATTTTDASGYWSISHATEGRFDVRITNGSSIRWFKYDSELQLTTLEVANLRVRNPADTFDYDIVPAAITADRQLNLPLITGTDTLAVLGLAQTFTADKTFNDNVNVTFGTGGDADMYYDGTNFYINPRVVGTGNVIITGTAILFINDTSNAQMTVGLTIHGGTNDDHHQTWKNDDVGHPMTGIAEADTFGYVQKAEGTSGGLLLVGLKDADGSAGLALAFVGILGEAADTTDTTTSVGVIRLQGQVTDGGTSSTAVAAGGNLLGIDNNGTTRFLVKGDGALHATNVTAGAGDLDGTALDDYDDVGLVRLFQRQRVNDIGVAMTKWDETIRANRDDLIRLGVLSSQGDFYNMQRMNDLLGGAIWQMHVRQREEAAALKAEIAALRTMLAA